ncbi:MAG: hypothetical protein HN842_07820 [Gammaproteobacteria bacterium]|jgi:hypothetical protein|nr:hypothetical protein [Gammaproteobacteria bacterium]
MSSPNILADWSTNFHARSLRSASATHKIGHIMTPVELLTNITATFKRQHPLGIPAYVDYYPVLRIEIPYLLQQDGDFYEVLNRDSLPIGVSHSNPLVSEAPRILLRRDHLSEGPTRVIGLHHDGINFGKESGVSEYLTTVIKALGLSSRDLSNSGAMDVILRYMGEGKMYSACKKTKKGAADE